MELQSRKKKVNVGPSKSFLEKWNKVKHNRSLDFEEEKNPEAPHIPSMFRNKHELEKLSKMNFEELELFKKRGKIKPKK